MAKRDKREAGKTFLEGILAKVPEDKRAAIREAVLANDEIVDYAGEGHLRHDEFSRMADALKRQTDEITTYRGQLDTWKGQLSSWYDNKKAELAAAAPVRRNDDDLEERPAVDLSGYVRQEDYERAILQTQEQGVQLMSLMSTLSMRHYHDFKEVLDPGAVVAHARTTNLPLDRAYEDYVRPRIEERVKKSHDDEVARAREEGAIEERKRQFTTPYPVGNAEPTTLDGLRPDFQKVNPVEAAVGDYYAGLQRRQA